LRGSIYFLRWSGMDGRYFRVAYRRLLYGDQGVPDQVKEIVEDFCYAHIGNPFGVSGLFFANDTENKVRAKYQSAIANPAFSMKRDKGSIPAAKAHSESQPTSIETKPCRTSKLKAKPTRLGIGCAGSGRRKTQHIQGPVYSEKRAFFCSELVAAAYRAAGVLRSNVSEGSFTPGSFAATSCPWLRNGVRMGKLHTVVFSKNDLSCWPNRGIFSKHAAWSPGKAMLERRIQVQRVTSMPSSSVSSQVQPSIETPTPSSTTPRSQPQRPHCLKNSALD